MASASPVLSGPAALRVLYVEDDPMLREMLATQLRAHRRVAAVEAFGSAREVVDGATADIDVALIDLSLGQNQPSGIEVGLALRATRRGLPIVIFSQYRVPNVDDVVPPRERDGWSFLQKGSDVGIDDLIEVLIAVVAAGYDAVGIAERLHLAHVSVRRELSLAYRVLVPHPQPGTDLRTAAVLEYLRLMPDGDEPAATS